MSFAGIKQFEENLRTLMESKAFKEADDGQRLRMGGMLLRSKYGLGSFGGLGKVHELKAPAKEHNSLRNRRDDALLEN